MTTAKCLLDKDGVAKWIGPELKCKGTWKCHTLLYPIINPINPPLAARECPDPGVPLNGFRLGDIFAYPHQVEFSCAAGFRLIGTAQRKCTARGEWSGEQPICKRYKLGGK
jgi:hypothetical protein